MDNITPKKLKQRYTQNKREWIKQIHKELMKKSTKYEWMVYKALPVQLRKRAKRQYSFSHKGFAYFFDIYLPVAKLCIEIDGGYHLSQRAQDAHRDKIVASYGIKTMRISNVDVQSPRKLNYFIGTIVHEYIDRVMNV